ncbi:MAG: GumC family protein [Sphingomonadaceae bacterium]
MSDKQNNGRGDFTAASAPASAGANAYPDGSYYPTRLGAADLGLAQIKRALIERRWLVLACVALGVAIATAITLLMTPLFRAGVLLELNPPQVEILEGSSSMTEGGQSVQMFLQTQYGLLESEALAQRVARELNLAADPDFANQEASREIRLQQATQRVRNGLTVAPESGSQLVRLFFTSPKPEQAARIVNSYADNFVKTNLERGFDASAFAREFLENQLATVQTELESSERALNAYAQETGIVTARSTGPDGQIVDGGSLEDASLAALNTALTNARIARISAEQKFRQAQQAGPNNTVIAGTSSLRQERAKLQAEYEQKLEVFRPDYPAMQELQRRIASLDRAIGQEAQQLTGGDLNTLRAEFQSARDAEQELERRVQALKGDVLGQRNTTIQSNILQREVDTNRALYDALLQRYKEIGVTGGVGKSPVSLVDRARAPTSPFRPNIPLNILAGLLLGLIIGVLLAVAFELVFDTVKLPDDVRQRMGMRLLGVVPETEAEEGTIEALDDPKSSVSEAYASARTALQFIREGGAPRVIALTSTRPAEGKSTSAYGLARSFARIGKRTLLIDADMRRPTFESAAGKDGGLMRLLTSEEPLSAHVQPSGHANLSLVPAGRGQGNAAELLASARLKAVIEEAKANYDVVIIDGPPVIGLSDAPLLASEAEATIVVVESGGARIGAVSETINRLRSSNANIAGVLLTKFPAKLADSDYYYYYDYSYGKSGARQSSRKISMNRDDS